MVFQQSRAGTWEGSKAIRPSGRRQVEKYQENRPVQVLKVHPELPAKITTILPGIFW